MKTFQSMLRAFLVVVLIAFLHTSTFAQDKSRLPSELNQNSSLAEIVDWLDRTSFANARVGLNESGSPNSEESNRGPYGDGTPSAKAVFSRGFRLARLDGCHLTLRNEAISVLELSGKRYGDDLASRLANIKGNTAGELLIWLDRLSYTKGRAPYRQTTTPEKAKLLGTWRTKFTTKLFFPKTVFSLSISGPEQGMMREVLSTESVTFTFDDKEMSEQFNAAFRQAIKLCRGK